MVSWQTLKARQSMYFVHLPIKKCKLYPLHIPKPIPIRAPDFKQKCLHAKKVPSGVYNGPFTINHSEVNFNHFLKAVFGKLISNIIESTVKVFIVKLGLP